MCGLDFDILHGFLGGNQCLDQFVRTFGRETPVGAEAGDKEFCLHILHGASQAVAEIRRRIEIVQSFGHQQICISIKPPDEFVALIAEIGFYFKFNAIAVLIAVGTQIASEFFAQTVFGKIRNVSHHTGNPQTARGNGVVAAVMSFIEIGVGQNRLTCYIIKRDILRGQFRRRRNHQGVAHTFGIGNRPLQSLHAAQAAADSRANSSEIHRADVAKRLADLPVNAGQRKSPFADRIKAQQAWLNLPLLPTTNIGSFPQTTEIRQARAAFKKGELSASDYEAAMKKEIALVVEEQEKLDLDVLVHGEAERNDMVEYFGELLSGFAFTQYGWVQSYGSRCVKPPIIFGDVSRPEAMTVAWSTYAQNLTKRPMKGMLTGPVTILQWSFVRNDIPRATVCKQIALALNDEVLDLEKAGIKVIQIDEPAIREGLPLKRADWDAYLNWAGESFRLSSAGCEDSTQIHTHMCYSEFNDILPAIAAMDADVITIETSRSDMELLAAFGEFKYPNDIGPGVYDIHSPRVPTEAEVEHLLRKAIEVVPVERLWVNPDCGLKTRGWKETLEQLQVMMNVTRKLRAELAK